MTFLDAVKLSLEFGSEVRPVGKKSRFRVIGGELCRFIMEESAIGGCWSTDIEIAAVDILGPWERVEGGE